MTAQLQAELYAENLYIEKLKAQLATLKRPRFGRSSEKLDRLIEQLELTITDLPLNLHPAATRAPAVTSSWH